MATEIYKRPVQWCLGIDNLVLGETGTLTTYFYPYVEDLTSEELKSFTLALSEFVRLYK